MRLWYKAEKINLNDSLGAGPSGVLRFELVEADEKIPNLGVDAQPVNP
jgi:hypothetical protein